MNKKLWAETRGSQKNCFTTTEEIRGGGVKVCVCRHFLRITSGASRVCRHSYQRVCQHMSALPDPQHVWTVLLSILSSKKRKIQNQPWCHHEPILNPPLSKSITPALPLPASFSVPPLPPSHSCLSNSSLSSFSFSYFRIFQHFPSLVHVSFFSLPPPFSSHTKNTSSFYSGKHHLIESPKCTTVCQKCQDVLIIINFV